MSARGAAPGLPATHLMHTCVDCSMYSIRAGMLAWSRSGAAINICTKPEHTALRTAGELSCASEKSPCT